MATRIKFHVTKTDKGWQGKKEGGQRASATGATKADVVKQTIELAKKQDASSVVIHKQDGTIQEERTFPKKSDPFPPEG
ncbi:hypothetical protein SDC9_20256 [bioreactor metagenome]|uniref:DUF2188 domain-containing protein n=1 Tax=bioreactor metagenome TaxID=1076179 RepID=A0A644U621_9ZZZZ